MQTIETELRQFRVYNVGLAKTGTTSVASIFNHYRTQHEFLLRDTGQMVKDFMGANMTEDEFRHFLRARDSVEHLDMDSTFCHGYYLDLLVEEFPVSQFIFTVRDCYSWVDSVINMMATHHYITHLDLIFGLPSYLLGNEEALRQDFDQYIDILLVHWASFNTKLLETLPKDQTLMLRTYEISSSLDKIASFVGIPAETLDHNRVHEFKAAKKLYLLHEMDYNYLEDKFNYYCSELMERLFPGYSLQDFLEGRRPLPNVKNIQDEKRQEQDLIIIGDSQ